MAGALSGLGPHMPKPHRCIHSSAVRHTESGVPPCGTDDVSGDSNEGETCARTSNCLRPRRENAADSARTAQVTAHTENESEHGMRHIPERAAESYTDRSTQRTCAAAATALLPAAEMLPRTTFA